MSTVDFFSFFFLYIVNNAMINLSQTFQSLPKKSGCYLFKNKRGKVLYVGKAKNLRTRVRSYFAASAELSPAKQQMVREMTDIDYITVRNEHEALLLESNLIKQHLPPYNVILKDDKSFVYIKITGEAFPRVTTARTVERDNSQYFGPYSNTAAVKHILRLLKRAFPFRTDKHDFIFDMLHAGKRMSQQQYATNIKQVTQVFKGKTGSLIQALGKKMQGAAKKRHYEKAAYFRDQIRSLEKLAAMQQAILPTPLNIDVVHFDSFEKTVYFTILKIRQGKLIDKLNAKLNRSFHQDQEILESFVTQFYLPLADQPDILIVPQQAALSDQEIRAIFNKKITITIPQKGKYKKLLSLAALNTYEYIRRSQPRFAAADDISKALTNLQKELGIKHRLERIECYDISNIQGLYAVGSMVVFRKGQPDRAQYRKFKIKYTKGSNDPAQMAEIVARRFRHMEWGKPNLIILDGGKGQLSSVKKTLDSLAITVPVAALAKRHEKLYLPLSPNKKSKKISAYTTINLAKNSPEYFLIQRIRDEAHRCAVSYYRLRHKKGMMT